MRSGSATGSSAERDNLAAFDHRSFSDLELRQVHVERHEAKAVVDDDAVAFEVERTREHDASGVDGCDGGTGLGVVVEAAMDAGERAIEDAAGAEGVCAWRNAERRGEAAGPCGVGCGFGERFVFNDPVRGNDLQGFSVGLNKFVGDGEGHLLVGRGSDGYVAGERGDGSIGIGQLNRKRVAAGSDFDVDAGESVPGGGVLRSEEGKRVALPPR